MSAPLVEKARAYNTNLAFGKYIENLIEKDLRLKERKEYVRNFLAETDGHRTDNVMDSYEKEKEYNELFGLTHFINPKPDTV